MIIGITGTLGVGKGTAVDILKVNGFDHYSARGFLAEKLSQEGREANRDNLVEIANRLRTENSPSYVAEQLYRIAVANNSRNSILESLRTAGEIEALRKKGNFILLAIDAKPETRYERITTRASETDRVSFDEFISNEKREWESRDPNKQNLKACIESADIFLTNDGTIEDLIKKLSTNFKFDAEGYLARRPTWDEAFMRETYLWASRSTCLRRKVGAVISTPDHALIAQGYNGSPRGTPNCTDLGFCERQKQNVPSGQMLEKCKAVHAESNAIINAGRQGKSVQDATLYCTTFPCQICSGIIINSGIKEIIYEADYANPEAKKSFEDAGIKVRKFEGVRYTGFSKLFRQT